MTTDQTALINSDGRQRQVESNRRYSEISQLSTPHSSLDVLSNLASNLLSGSGVAHPIVYDQPPKKRKSEKYYAVHLESADGLKRARRDEYPPVFQPSASSSRFSTDVRFLSPWFSSTKLILGHRNGM